MSKKAIIILILIILAVVLVVVYINSTIPVEESTLRIATIWQADMKGDSLDFSNSYRKVQDAYRGFTRALSETKGDLNLDIQERQFSEELSVDSFVTAIAEADHENDILMAMGANSDEPTMYISNGMNFLKVPMLIPFADGDLAPDSGIMDYSVRLMPTTKKYAEYFNVLFPGLIFDYVKNVLYADKPSPEIEVNIAVFFANNFSGHNTAVAIGQTLLDNGYNINAYEPYDMLNFTVQNTWKESPEKLENVDAVICIGEDGDPTVNISDVWHQWNDRNLSPIIILLGYNPDSIDVDALSADNIYRVQVKLDFSNCPADIESRSEAKGYAAGWITAKALQTAAAKQSPEPTGIRLWLMSEEKKMEVHQNYITSFRENIRSALFDMSGDIPCYGNANLKINPDERVSLELVRYTSQDQYHVVDEAILSNKILEKYSGNGASANGSGR